MKSFLLTVSCGITALLVTYTAVTAATISDDFSDLNDTANPAWTHLNNFVVSTGQNWDASSGQYRLTAPNNGFASGGNQFGFVGSYTGPVLNDSITKADFVQNDIGLGFGVGTRLNGQNGPFNSATRLQGYVYGYEPNSNGGSGEMVMYRWGFNPFNPFEDMGDPAGVEGVDWIRKVHLDLANKDYTFTVTAVGNTISGIVTEIGGGIVAYQTHTDTTFTSGYSGIASVGASSATQQIPSDITIDNFSIQAVPEPATVVLLACGAGAMLIGKRRSRA